MTTQAITHEATGSATARLSLGGVFLAMASALVLLYFAGFAQAAQYHDSAHDTRHTLAFPCH